MKKICRKLCILLLAGVILFPGAAVGSKYVQLLQKIDCGGEYIIFRPATTRKLKIVPPLMKVLENRSR